MYISRCGDERQDPEAQLLIVEGRDEQFCFEAALRDHLGLIDIQVMPIGGKTPLTRNLMGLIITG